MKQALRDRTARIQGELDAAAAATTDAAENANEIRTALGDIDGERQRLFAEAEQQAAAILTDGRTRLDEEIADLHAHAEADIASAATRGGDELRAEIGRYAAGSIDTVVARTLDDAAQQELIESFIQRVGATGVTS